ncbi:site-specific integrase [Seonamhaeicola sp. NFXS20]|uniref:site-specific integrase n=1 Tax=Seonamhaeicola sp. NFXS20 TaxID=2816959 RepID=UPI003B8D36E3
MQTNSTFSILFFTRKPRGKTKNHSVYVRITINGKCSEISLKRSVSLNTWDSHKGRVRGNNESARVLNSYLDQVYNKFLDSHKQLIEEGRIISSSAIKARYTGEDDINKSLKDLIEYHNTKMKSILKPGTMKNYSTTERYLKKFLKQKLKINDIYLKQLSYRFIVDFEQYLRTVKNKKNAYMLSNNGVMKHLERFKKMMNLAYKLEWIIRNPFKQFQLKFEKFNREYLSDRELKLIENTNYKNGRLERIKDCFVFSCYTGLSYTDVKQLAGNKISRGIDNRLWIFTKREKTNETVKIPILPKAMDILNKYNDVLPSNSKAALLPLCSNQKANSYLKEIAKDCGINKNMTFHMARHTFATTVMLSNGVPIETVSKLLGHTKLSTTQIYARVIESKISEDIGNLLQRFDNKTNQKETQQNQSIIF